MNDGTFKCRRITNSSLAAKYATANSIDGIVNCYTHLNYYLYIQFIQPNGTNTYTQITNDDGGAAVIYYYTHTQ